MYFQHIDGVKWEVEDYRFSFVVIEFELIDDHPGS